MSAKAKCFLAWIIYGAGYCLLVWAELHAVLDRLLSPSEAAFIEVAFLLIGAIYIPFKFESEVQGDRK